MLDSARQHDLLQLFTGMPGTTFGLTELEFVPVRRDGRVNVEMHSLYSTEQTGPAGPAAAVVRYLPTAEATPHLHPGYEIIYIISGELETDDGSYGPGSLLVMPPDSVHAPRSPHGCVGIAVWEQPVQSVPQLAPAAESRAE
jgi:quercetin dioxygenase-like cupin family protein